MLNERITVPHAVSNNTSYMHFEGNTLLQKTGDCCPVNITLPFGAGNIFLILAHTVYKM